MRLEDLDAERTQPGAGDQILRTLENFGLFWDDAVLRQTNRSALYRMAAQQLAAQGLVYGCSCSRKQAAGRCASGCGQALLVNREARAWRVRVPAKLYGVCDAIQGWFSQNLYQAVGDFVIKRADGPFAYQLAVVVDDAAQGVTNVVRGADLLDNTPRQVFLQQKLALPTPHYAHIPVAVDRNGAKLSKSTGAGALDLSQPAEELWRALECLAHAAPAGLKGAPVHELLRWAIASWQLTRVPRQATIHCR